MEKVYEVVKAIFVKKITREIVDKTKRREERLTTIQCDHCRRHG